MKLEGIAVSPGIAIGPAYIYQVFEEIPVERTVAPDREDEDLTRLEQAFQKADGELKKLAESSEGTEQGRIFLAHQQMLWDEEITELARQTVKSEHKTPEWSVYSAFEENIKLLTEVDDPVISARGADLADIRRRLLRILAGREEQTLRDLPGLVVVIAKDLTPSDMAVIDHHNVLGIVTESGGPTSHTAIIANSHGLPAVLGVKGCTARLQNGQTVCVDALTGVVLVEPEDAELRGMRERQDHYLSRKADEARYLAARIRLSNGDPVEIGLNIDGADRVDGYQYVDFVGLLRTEFLYMDSDHLPTEDEQYHAYTRIMKHADGKPVTLRTLDIGGDKKLPYMDLPKEDNPFLGQRALRLCLARPELFKTQLRAAIRASAHGELHLMFPMVSCLEDFRSAKKIYGEARAELEAQGVNIGSIKLGIMIEVPSIALMADTAAVELDFASIGTNDLCQYLCAADRMNDNTARYYQTLSPAMVLLLGYVITAFRKAKKPISVCGEMAADRYGALLLAGLGLRKFSVGESKIASIKALLANTDMAALENTVRRIQNATTQDEVIELLKNGAYGPV
jgi:phosphotransferase system enzyme I (PtsI)